MLNPKVLIESVSNLSFRDLAALVAMHGMVSSLRENETLNTEGTAGWAYQMADALIVAADAPAEELEEAEAEIEYDMSVNPNDEEVETKVEEPTNAIA
jgi:hypothetical protein